MGRLAGVLVFVVVTACACTSADPARDPVVGGSVTPDQPQPLPAAADLDAARGAAIAASGDLDVTIPFLSQHASSSERSLLLFAPQDEMAYAVLRIAPPPGIPQRITASALGPVWVGLADYVRGQWDFRQPVEGLATFELDPDASFSPGGWLYLAVVCPAGGTGRLDAAALTWEDEIDWNFEINSTDKYTRVAWRDVPFRRFGVLRSMVRFDPAPYLIAVVDEPYAVGKYKFYDCVNEDAAGVWVPAINDNGTPEDLTDDFPFVAPEINYYYSIVALYGDNWGARTLDYIARIPWGTRSKRRNSPPSSDGWSRFFANNYDLSELTDAQVQFTTSKCFGALDVTKDEVERFRQFNEDFLASNGQSLLVASPSYDLFGQRMIYGDYVDPDGDWPYIDRHPDWFFHAANSYDVDLLVGVRWPSYSTYPNNRYGLLLEIANPGALLRSTYGDYLASSVVSLVGESAFDGVIVYNAEPNFEFYPYPDIFEDDEYPYGPTSYFSKDFYDFGKQLSRVAGLAPRRPKTIAEVNFFGDFDQQADPESGLDYRSFDALHVSSFAFRTLTWSLRMDAEGWVNQLNNILYWQPEVAVYLSTSGSMYLMDAKERLMYFGSYLLVRDSHTYLGSNTIRIFSQVSPCWYPEFNWNSGDALTGSDGTLQSLCLGPDYRWGYRRDFENGIVVLCPDDSGEITTTTELEPGPYEYMVLEGTGAVEPNGTQTSTMSWEPLNDGEPIDSFSFDGGGCYIIRRTTQN